MVRPKAQTRQYIGKRKDAAKEKPNDFFNQPIGDEDDEEEENEEIEEEEEEEEEEEPEEDKKKQAIDKQEEDLGAGIESDSDIIDELDEEEKAAFFDTDIKDDEVDKDLNPDQARELHTLIQAVKKVTSHSNAVALEAKSAAATRKAMQSGEYCIQRAPLVRLIREIVSEVSDKSFKWQENAVVILHWAAEVYMTQLFGRAQVCAAQAGRKTINPEDIACVSTLLSDGSVEPSKYAMRKFRKKVRDVLFPLEKGTKRNLLDKDKDNSSPEAKKPKEEPATSSSAPAPDPDTAPAPASN